jgi:FixJ family two-component response regulator
MEALALAQTSLISIIDDDISVLEATTTLLESYGYATAAFTSAQKFLQSQQFADTTCLLTDVRMPGMSGIDLQERLIGADHQIPTIVMTAHVDEHVREAALKRGALAFLTKPVDAERLISCLESALAARRSAGTAQ